jgi:hypothetical protein
MSTPAALYRNAIDLNRYSNSVARRVMNAYNDIIIDAANQLRTIDELTAPVKAARLRSILAQLKESLAGWAGDATEITALELQGLTELQSEFVTEQLRKVLPAGSRDAVRTVEISPQFAQSVVTTDPTQLNVVALSDDLFAAVQGAPQLPSALPLPRAPPSHCPMARCLPRHSAASPQIKRSGSAKWYAMAY